MRLVSLTVAALIAASPLPVLAQDAADDFPGNGPDIGVTAPTDTEAALGGLADTMGDPAVQDRLARTLQTLGEVLLDMPLAPLAEAAAEIVGEDAKTVDPDMTLRKIAPDAGRLPDDIATNLPRMMNRMAGMAGGLEAMLPALRGMAARLEALSDELR